MPGFNPGSCNEPDVKSTSTATVTSRHTMRLGMYSYPEPGVLFKQNTSPERIHARINSGGQSSCGDDPHENVRDTDEDHWADIAQRGLRPSCHPRSSLTLPVSSSPPPTLVPPPCVDPHPKSIQFKRFTPRKVMPSKLMVPGPRKGTGWTESLSSDSVTEISKKLEIHNSLTKEFFLILMGTLLIDSWTVGKTHHPEIVGGKSVINYDGFLKLTEQARNMYNGLHHPNTPQRHRNAERRERERDSRVLGSPENRHVPQQHNYGPPIPFQLNIPQGFVPPPHSQDDPFQIVHHNGQELHLSQGIAAQIIPVYQEK
ncbi:hypothetical protein BT96DRAFT_990610 [Gymnopus androsaceus JB14]|uniref:Uncharacterized protein n=1 Tax=Gymnopus androsaceus JB14 TaxID=1447944 RepID=A0A6A4I314_9AGAR|nr:hypothetical protein BT96DRAFT_990610 [Gymnopus androsaceus JB14]